MTKKLWSLFIVLLLVVTAEGQSNELQQYYSGALEAYRKGDFVQFYDLIIKAHHIHPYHQGILYQAGIAAALNHKNPEAIQYLKEAILIQADFPLNIPDLASLQHIPEFEQLKAIQRNASKPILRSDTAFILKDRTLHTEGVTKIEGEDIFYLGSIHRRKIIKVEHGVTKDFTKEGQDGLGSVFGVKADSKKNILWVSASPMPEMIDYNAILPSAVFKFDLKTGELIKKFLPENPALELVLGDIAINRKGDIFASDSKNNFIFKVNESSGKLEQFYSSDDFWNIQGITFSDDGRFLFIADYIKGIFRLELSNRKLTPVTRAVDVSLKSIDGLTFYNNSLIAIQNGLTPMRVTQYQLNKDYTAVTAFTIIDQNHPAFNDPTLGSISGDTFYYVANSQWNGYDKEHNIKPEDQLQDIVILKIKVK